MNQKQSESKSKTLLACPNCNKEQEVETPDGACQHSYKCAHCGEVTELKEASCCGGGCSCSHEQQEETSIAHVSAH